MSINQSNGVLQGKINVQEFIEYLTEHKEIYGDTEVRFMHSGSENCIVQFDHFKDAIVIDLYEDYD